MAPYILAAFLATVACVWAEARDRKRAKPRSYEPTYHFNAAPERAPGGAMIRSRTR